METPLYSMNNNENETNLSGVPTFKRNENMGETMLHHRKGGRTASGENYPEA